MSVKFHFNSFCKSVVNSGLFTPLDEFCFANLIPRVRSSFTRRVPRQSRASGKVPGVQQPPVNPNNMTKTYHSYVAPADPSAQELLARILQWSMAIPQMFNVVVAYEDIHAARRAKELCDRLRCRLGRPFDFETHLWRFDVLRIPQLEETAVSDAVQAPLIIYATRGDGSLPPETQSWTELWLSRRLARKGALVLLVEPMRQLNRIEDSPQYEYLQKIAHRARMEFFASGYLHPGTRLMNAASC